MSRFTAQGLTYQKAKELIACLKKQGIEANITAGGVAIYPSSEQSQVAEQICADVGAIFSPGLSTHQEIVLYENIKKKKGLS